MPFDLDVIDADWRSQLSDEQLDALERRAPVKESQAVAAMSPVTAHGEANRVHHARGREVKRVD